MLMDALTEDQTWRYDTLRRTKIPAADLRRVSSYNFFCPHPHP
jgi:hypothetical protein